MTGAADMLARISADELAAFATRVFEARGMAQEMAAQVADVLVWADLRGVDSHGVERLPSYLSLIERGQMNPQPQMTFTQAAPAAFRIDADRAPGPAPMIRAMREAVERARKFGVATGLVSRCAHTGAVGYYAQWAARQGCVGIVMGSGPPLMAYQGARVASLSTSPLAIAVPGGPDGALLLDMATAVASNGKLKQAAREGVEIPEGWALDASGEPTRDPSKTAVLLPIGGPKGAGLGLMFECLTSVLAGAPLLANMLGAGRKPFHMQSEMVIAIDVAALAQTMKDLPRADADMPIRLPGERGEAEARRRAVEGLPIGQRLRAQLEEIAQQCAVAPPAFMQTG